MMQRQSDSPLGKKILHVVPRIHQEASGPTYSVMRLCESQAKQGENVELHVTQSAGQYGDGYSIIEHGRTALSGKFLSSPSLKHVLSRRDIAQRLIHSHGLWMMPNIYPGLIADSDTLIVSPRGTMSDWAWKRSYWLKRFAWFIGQRKMLRRCNCFHATAEHEVLDIRKRGFDQPVALIPNGVDVPDLSKKNLPNGQRILVFLARLHPVKGIENLIRAWDNVASGFPDWKLVIAGGGTPSYERQLVELSASLRTQRLEFAGPVYGERKKQLLANAELYVLPSFTENFAISVAEAMASATPVITTDRTPWNQLDSKRAGWCIPVGQEALTECFRVSLALDSTRLFEMGRNARKWMGQDYSWDEVSQKMLQTYRWLDGTVERPKWIFD